MSKGKIILFSNPSDKIKSDIAPVIFAKNTGTKTVGYMPSDGTDKKSIETYSPEWEEFVSINGGEFKLINNSLPYTDQLNQIHILIISGGNTFKLRKLLRDNGWDEEIKRFYNNGGIIVAFSAGAIVLSPSLETATQSDNVHVGLTDLSGLNLFDFLILPHADNKHEQIKLLEQSGKKFKALMDEDYLLI